MSSSKLQTFISAEQIQTPIQEMALEISSDYAELYRNLPYIAKLENITH